MIPEAKAHGQQSNHRTSGPRPAALAGQRSISAGGELLPSLRSAQQRTHPGDPLRSEEQRRTGAGGFVRSATEKDDLPVPRDFAAARGDFFEGDADRAWNRAGGFGPTAKIDDIEILAGLQAVA